MLVLFSAKQGHAAKAHFFCPVWELAPLHCVEASFSALRRSPLFFSVRKAKGGTGKMAEAQYHVIPHALTGNH